MLSVINLLPVLAYNPKSPIAQQNLNNVNLGKILLGLHSLIDPFVRVAPYRMKLSSDASLGEKVMYCLFRTWNAVKAIFNQSEWQCAKRQLVEGPVSQFILDIAKDAFDDEDKFQRFKTMFEKEAEFLLHLSIDNKVWNVSAQNRSDFAKDFGDLLEDEFKDIIDVYNANQAAVQGLLPIVQNVRQGLPNLTPQNLQAQLAPQFAAAAIGLLPAAMDLTPKLDLNQECLDYMSGKASTAEVTKSVYSGNLATH